MDINRYGKQSNLYIKVAGNAEKSVLKKTQFTAPFKIMSPFYDEQNRMSLMVVSVSAGIMAGDRQHVQIDLEKNAQIEIHSQSFEKIHKMDNDSNASRHTILNIAAGAALLYSPLPTIPFAGSSYESTTDIYLEDSTSRLFYSEILSCGRSGRGERFAYKSYKNLTKVYQENHLIYMDNAIYEPAKQNPELFCMYEGYSHLLNLLLVNIPCSADQEAALQTYLSDQADIEGGLSRTETNAVCVRALANSSEMLIDLTNKTKYLFHTDPEKCMI